MKKLLRNIYYYMSLLNKNYVPTIFMYHSINENDLFFSISKKDFEIQIKKLIDKGHNFINMDDIKSKNYNNMSVAITFDDGYKDNLLNALPILEKYEIPAIIYVTKSLINNTNKYGLIGLNEQDLKYLFKHPLVTIGNHTLSHNKLHKLSYKEQFIDISEYNKYLEDLSGEKINHFAAPYGRYNEDTIKILNELNFDTAVTVKRGNILNSKSLLELNRISIDKGKMNFIIDYLTRFGK